MPAFARPRSEAPARIDRQLQGDEFRAANVADGSKASVRGSRERSLGLEVLAAASISRKVGDEWQVYVRSGRPPQRCPNDGFAAAANIRPRNLTNCNQSFAVSHPTIINYAIWPTRDSPVNAANGGSIAKWSDSRTSNSARISVIWSHSKMSRVSGTRRMLDALPCHQRGRHLLH